MRRETMALACAVALGLGGCAQEVVTVHNSSFAAQFAQLNQKGWQVSGVEQGGKAPPSVSDQNVRVVKEADFSQLMFHTNFQVDDPKLREQQRGAAPPASNAPARGSNNPPPALPFGTAMPGQ